MNVEALSPRDGWLRCGPGAAEAQNVTMEPNPKNQSRLMYHVTLGNQRVIVCHQLGGRIEFLPVFPTENIHVDN